MSGLRCGRCAVIDWQVFDKGLLVDPVGWSFVTVSGLPMVNRSLCPTCTAITRRVLDGAPLASPAPTGGEPR